MSFKIYEQHRSVCVEEVVAAIGRPPAAHLERAAQRAACGVSP